MRLQEIHVATKIYFIPETRVHLSDTVERVQTVTINNVI